MIGYFQVDQPSVREGIMEFKPGDLVKLLPETPDHVQRMLGAQPLRVEKVEEVRDNPHCLICGKEIRETPYCKSPSGLHLTTKDVWGMQWVFVWGLRFSGKYFTPAR